MEFNRVNKSYFERQVGDTRTYANRLSMLTNIMALIWTLGLACFYLSLALVYGRFTYYFCLPTLLLGLISGIYLAHIITLQS